PGGISSSGSLTPLSQFQRAGSSPISSSRSQPKACSHWPGSKFTACVVRNRLLGCSQFHRMREDQFLRWYFSCRWPSIFSVSRGTCAGFTTWTAKRLSARAASPATSAVKRKSPSQKRAQPVYSCREGTRKREKAKSVLKGFPSRWSIFCPSSILHGRSYQPL